MSEQQSENHLQPYVGLNIGRRVMFLSASEPTEATHGHLFHAVVGPFDTVEGARFMERYGGGNPHCRCVDEAERLAKHYPELCKPEPAEAA